MIGEVAVPGQALAGGPSNATERLVRELVSAGANVTVVMPADRDRREERFRLGGADVIAVPFEDRLGLVRRLGPWTKAATPVVESLGPDVVHGQSILTGGAVAAGMPSSTPSVVTARGNVRRDTLEAANGIRAHARVMLAERAIRDVLGSVDCVVNVHPEWRVNLPREPRSIVHIPNIVDEAFFETPRATEDATVLYCGGSRRIKGFDVLRAAWPLVRSAVPDAVLRCVGWPTDASLDGLAGAAVRGAVCPDELAREMARATLVVIPSRYEVSPIVLAEAWASGTPAVVTDAGGMLTLAPGAATVVPAEAPEALAAAITGVLDGSIDPSALVAAGRVRAESHRAAAVVESHLALYRTLLAGRR